MNLWKIHSRSIWLKIGNALSQYFFKLVQAKRIGETMKKLMLSGIKITSDKVEIPHGVYTHCKKLYKKHPRVESFNVVRDKVLALITKKFTTENSELLRKLPSGEEIEKIIISFPSCKSPRGDGVTYDFQKGCWSFVGNCCKDTVIAFWSDAKLSVNTINNIVKMMPKHSDLLEIIDNWHNLTMLTTTYKIILKILAECFTPMIPNIVDQQQTRFVHGRCITDNIIAFKLGQEHAVATNQDVIFMKLNFKKAFDHVDHNFIWVMLKAMHVDPFVITLIWGLVTNAKEKVYVNGLFTMAFPLERGVRQGDPMSPLLFALSSQPLMSLLESKCMCGELASLYISDQESLLYQLFVDDAGRFFAKYPSRI